ncbi:MAG: sigma-54 dependent transcriptional regulator [Planctomycetota bacterium]
MSENRILIVDDEPGIRDVLTALLKKDGYEVGTADTGKKALRLFDEKAFDLVITDLRMEDMDGIQLLRTLKERRQRQLVIIMTAFSAWDSAVEAMRLGAYDYIAKPFDNTNLRMLVARAFEVVKLYRDADLPPGEVLKAAGSLIGNTAQMQEIQRLIARIAPTDSTVLITGESGTGKELVARALHACSLRSHAPFLAVNCGAFTETLLESELFGHVKGSFTGAIVDKKGLFEVADKGTFFLDEIGDLSRETQVKLLRFLEERELKRVGGTETIRVDVRIIAATNKSLEESVQGGEFRQDLYYRLNVIPIHLPPLRERTEDIPLLAGHLIARHAPPIRKETTGIAAMRKEITGIDKGALDALMRYDWPGNVRELENTLQRAMALTEGSTIRREDLVGTVRSAGPAERVSDTEISDEGMDLERRLEEIERKYIITALQKTNQNITNAAQLLKMSFRSLRYRIKKLNIR